MINMASDHFAHCVTHLLQLVHEWLSILALMSVALWMQFF